MVHTPTWLTLRAVDGIAEEPEEYDRMRVEFMNVLSEEEESRNVLPNDGNTQLSLVMNHVWKRGTFCLDSGDSKISPSNKSCLGSGHIISLRWPSRKDADKKEYDVLLRKAFDCPSPKHSDT
ncbi:hypothetical protein AJ80_09337 [Polytolypa hystricis UAMH7299]|uniref:Uncharacterized protein n=1 Tax=Polytolypa hystricis (strain UAMH7299) TaxID=1447883 RepID=A0A2B7WSJ9_POLH7|nr:hypothetical protein AJ80_09337 [Polytolypa hystricis UAMH7299]